MTWLRIFRFAEIMKLIFLVFIFLTVSTSEFDPKKHKNWNLLPHSICGIAWKSRIIGGKEAPMNSYPWIIRIGYQSENSKRIFFLCGGVLVTSTVILTAAHCTYHPQKKMKIRVIRLGEHNTETNPDCNGEYCADSVIDIAPSEIIVPKIHVPNVVDHDVALIRLEKKIKFTSFVKPICLRGSPPKNLIGSITEVAGWGIYDTNKGSTSTKLLFVSLKVVDKAYCENYFGKNINIELGKICVGGERGKDSCAGDSGGPLMRVETGSTGPRYFLLGLVSFGVKQCGDSSALGVYTNVYSYTEWILNNLKKTADDSIQIQ